MRVETDKDTCVGAGQCALTAPEIFDSDEDGLVELLRQPGESERDAVHEAVELCPARAIAVHE